MAKLKTVKDGGNTGTTGATGTEDEAKGVHPTAQADHQGGTTPNPETAQPTPGTVDTTNPDDKLNTDIGGDGVSKVVQTDDPDKTIGERAQPDNAEHAEDIKDHTVTSAQAAAAVGDAKVAGVAGHPDAGSNRGVIGADPLPNPTEPMTQTVRSTGTDMTGSAMRNVNQSDNLGNRHPNDGVFEETSHAALAAESAANPQNKEIGKGPEGAGGPVWPAYQNSVIPLKPGTEYYAHWLHDPRNTDMQRHVEQNYKGLADGTIERRGLPASYWNSVVGNPQAMPPVFVRAEEGGVDRFVR